MTLRIDKATLRQAAYLNRSRRARFWGRVLVPVTLMTVSAALWSDPLIKPRLETGLQTAIPMAQTWIENFGKPPQEIADAGAAAEAAADDGVPDVLPTSKTPVNRP